MKWAPYKERNVIITGYKVRYWRSGKGAASPNNALNTEFTADSLVANTEYVFQVAANCAHGCGPFSEPFPFKTLGGKLLGVTSANQACGNL